MKKNLCFAPFVFTDYRYLFFDYRNYIPFYVYSILRSYPDSYVKIFVKKRLKKKQKLALSFLRDNLSTSFEVKENYFNNIPYSKNNKKSRCLRWLLPYKEFEQFENVYMGDVDFLIIKENPSLLDSHLQHCKEINLPYSNKIRDLSSKRLIGWHFIKTKEYFDRMNRIIDYYTTNFDKIPNDITTDEPFLYRIIDKSIGFGKLNQTSRWCPPHGVHLGWFRSHITKKDINSLNFLQILHSKPDLQYILKDLIMFRKQILDYFKDPLFNEILSIINSKKICLQFKSIEKAISLLADSPR